MKTKLDETVVVAKRVPEYESRIRNMTDEI
jgi:hypothetical protein